MIKPSLIAQAMDFAGSALIFANTTPLMWYAIPLILAISLVYGATRHERLKEIVEHSIRTLVWLGGFLFVIFLAVWFAGFGTNSEDVSVNTIKYTICLVAWLSAGFLLTVDAYYVSKQEGNRCLFSGGLYCIVFGIKQGVKLLIPTAIMLIALLWAVATFFNGV